MIRQNEIISENLEDSIVVLDPKNNLFGSNFCPADMDNKLEGQINI